jgi:hypothetical protein
VTLPEVRLCNRGARYRRLIARAYKLPPVWIVAERKGPALPSAGPADILVAPALGAGQGMLAKHQGYSRAHFEDLPEIRDWVWSDA